MQPRSVDRKSSSFQFTAACRRMKYSLCGEAPDFSKKSGASVPHSPYKRCHLRKVGVIFAIFALCFSLLPPVLSQVRPAPEAETGRTEKVAVRAKRQMVVSANRLASEAGLAILRRGGNAVDAAIAVQMVLTLVEPQSSGIGGGAFLLYYDAKTQKLLSYDGRETAPRTARGDRFLNAEGKPLEFYNAVVGGKSVGVPGVLRMLEMVHKQHGKLPWKDLFLPAIQLASDGFPISPRLHQLVSREKYLRSFEPAKSYFYLPNGSAKPVGTLLVNRPLAEVYRSIAKSGADAFYKGEIARDIVATVTKAPVNPGDLNLTDLGNYQAKQREPVCGPYRNYKLCSMGPPSSGGIAVLQILGILQNFDLASLKTNPLEAVHLFSEAGKLAFADRNTYVADTDFVQVPIPSLLDSQYLQRRASLINANRSIGKAEPGNIPTAQRQTRRHIHWLDLPSTSHLVIVDKDGNAVSMTTSIEDAFGSRLMVRGFLLNNQLTDFNFIPEENGKPVANRVEALKRPRSSMSPTIVFDREGKPILIIGSPGGSAIINFVAKTLVGVLDWNLDVQEAIALPHFGSRNGPTELEADTNFAAFKQPLEAKGHQVLVLPLTSGLHAIQLKNGELIGGADPRREGIALGD